jgi:catechol-2,3-dioxygenase
MMDKIENMKITHLDHLVLTVEDIEKSCDFYQKCLGMVIKTFKGNRKALHFGNQKINLHQSGAEFKPNARMAMPGSEDLCFITDTDLKSVITHLKQLNITIEEGPVKRTGASDSILSIYIRDPDGNLIELANRIPES